jgi:hypothetical protein
MFGDENMTRKYRLAFPLNDAYRSVAPAIVFSIFLIIWGRGFIFPVILFALFGSQIPVWIAYLSTEYCIFENTLTIKSSPFMEERVSLVNSEISECDLNYQDFRTFFRRTTLYWIDTQINGEKVLLRTSINKGEAVRVKSSSGVYILTPKEPELFFQDLCESVQKSVN